VPPALAYLANLTYDDIAQLLDIKQSHVGVLLRAKQRLRHGLQANTIGGLE
jgi:DNA-directed RNA polymerase specialized sigma24 family protein